MNYAATKPEREVWVDWLRTTAIFLVVLVHSTEPFYLGGEGSLILTRSDALWVSLIDSFARACVPVFIVASSYLQFPLHYPASQFLARRFKRVVIPFIVWTIVYALVWGEPVQNFKDLLLNFNYAAGHLWFVYMLVGIYLLIPMLSPWAEKVSRRQLLFYLAVCFITTLIPFARMLFGGETPVIYGPSGIPAFAKYPLWGECSWNSYGVFYYFSGFIGYILLGLYVRRFVGHLTAMQTVVAGVLPWVVGFVICCGGFYALVESSAATGYPVEGAVGLAALWETPWFYDSTGVAFMAVGWIIVYKKISSSGRMYNRLTLPLARCSYGVYLCHMLILVYVSAYFRQWLGTGNEGLLGVWTTPVQIVLTAVVTYCFASIVSLLLGRVPRIGKYITG